MVKSKAEVEHIVNQYIEAIKKVFFVQKVYLFGSYAKNTPKEWSDIDIAIVSEDFEHMNDYIAMKILSKLRKDIDYSIEAIPLTPKEVISPTIGTIQYSVINEGKLIT